MNRKHIVILLVVVIISVIIVPIIINESYKANVGYKTLWGASEILLYFGSAISGIGTIVIGLIAIDQSKRANDINDRLLKLQEISSTPFLHVDHENTKLQGFADWEFDFLLAFRNETDHAIMIDKISGLKINSFSNVKLEIPFCEEWTKHYTVLPKQVKEVNFMESRKSNEEKLIVSSEFMQYNKFTQVICTLEIDMHFVNSLDIYTQKIEFYLQIFSFDGKKDDIRIFNLENDILYETSSNKSA